uniref:Uncharacterized protein n=1 Tax=Parastrongyloides trichosuri TaxID=131310 RepID=A0A0N5A3K5_PARTI
MLLLIALIYCVPLYLIYAEDDYKKCYTNKYHVVIYGQFTCNGKPHQPKKVSLIEYSGNWISSKVIQNQIPPLKGKNSIYHHRQIQKTPNTEFSVSMEVMHFCNPIRRGGRPPCPFIFRGPIPTHFIDCQGDDTIAYWFSIDLNSGRYRGRSSCDGPFGK